MITQEVLEALVNGFAVEYSTTNGSTWGVLQKSALGLHYAEKGEKQFFKSSWSGGELLGVMKTCLWRLPDPPPVDFNTALQALKAGKRVSRLGWSGPCEPPLIVCMSEPGYLPPLRPEDLEATDWVVCK